METAAQELASVRALLSRLHDAAPGELYLRRETLRGGLTAARRRVSGGLRRARMAAGASTGGRLLDQLMPSVTGSLRPHTLALAHRGARITFRWPAGESYREMVVLQAEVGRPKLRKVALDLPPGATRPASRSRSPAGRG
jgi:hypothetical protein